MSDDYLFDGTGAPDPDVERLEQMLGRLRSNASAPPITRPSNAGRYVDADDEPRTTTTNVDRRTTYLGVRFLGPRSPRLPRSC